MPNKIKTSGSTTKLTATRNTNFKIGVTGSDDYGPTSSSGFYNGITPPLNGYTIYVHRVSGGPSIHVANDDTQCIFFLKSFGATGNTINEVLSWSSGRTDLWVQTGDLTIADLAFPITSFSQTFTGGTSPGSTLENAWTTFRQSLTGTYTQFVWSSTNGSSITVSDSVNVQLIANALRTGTTGTNVSVFIGANRWRVVLNCSNTTPTPANAIEFTNDSICSCGGAGKYTLRPWIRNANWGGTNQSTCGAATQTITITFS